MHWIDFLNHHLLKMLNRSAGITHIKRKMNAHPYHSWTRCGMPYVYSFLETWSYVIKVACITNRKELIIVLVTLKLLRIKMRCIRSNSLWSEWVMYIFLWKLHACLMPLVLERLESLERKRKQSNISLYTPSGKNQFFLLFPSHESVCSKMVSQTRFN